MRAITTASIMILPECDVCCSDDGLVLLSFSMTAADHEWDTSGVDGHPPWQAWYCKDHAIVARRFTTLPRNEAGAKILEAITTSTE